MGRERNIVMATGSMTKRVLRYHWGGSQNQRLAMALDMWVCLFHERRLAQHTDSKSA